MGGMRGQGGAMGRENEGLVRYMGAQKEEMAKAGAQAIGRAEEGPFKIYINHGYYRQLYGKQGEAV